MAISIRILFRDSFPDVRNPRVGCLGQTAPFINICPQARAQVCLEMVCRGLDCHKEGTRTFRFDANRGRGQRRGSLIAGGNHEAL